MELNKILRALIPVTFGADSPEQECLNIWKTPTAGTTTDIYPGMWQAAGSSYQEACKKFDPQKKSLVIDLPARTVNSTGYKLNGMELYIDKGTTVSVTIVYTKKKDKKGRERVEKNAVYKFSKPIIGYCNFKLNLSFGEKIGGALGVLSKETLKRIVEKISIEPYDKSKTGSLMKPMVIAFDQLEVQPPNSIGLKIAHKQYLNNGWGIFSFGNSEEDCVGANTKSNPSYFLGDKFGGYNSADECYSTLAGPRFGEPMVKWLLKVPEWKKIYDKYLSENNKDEFIALTSTINYALGTGIPNPTASWGKVANEENILGSGFIIWKKNQK